MKLCKNGATLIFFRKNGGDSAKSRVDENILREAAYNIAICVLGIGENYEFFLKLASTDKFASKRKTDRRSKNTDL